LIPASTSACESAIVISFAYLTLWGQVCNCV